MKRRAWNDAPIRFAHNPSYGSVAEHVQIELLKWYMDNDMPTKTVTKK